MQKNQKKPENSQENPQNSDVISTQRNRLAGQGFWTPVNKTFTELRSQGLLDANQFAAAVMMLCWCNEKTLRYSFEMSRGALAKIANCNEKIALQTLRKLVMFGVIKEVFKRKGCNSRYAWNVDNFTSDVSNLSTWDTGTCLPEGQDLSTTDTGPVYQGYNTCIVFIINSFYIRLRTSQKDFVDNFHDAVEADAILKFTESAWPEAIAKCSRAYGYDRVHLIIKNHPINFFEVIEPSKTLAKLCRDPQLISDLRDRYEYFKTDKDFSFYVDKNFNELTQHLLKLEKPEYFAVQ